MAASPHVTVLLEESLEYLAVRPEGFYVDVTAGGAGHSQAIAERLTEGRLLAMDCDEAACELAAQRLAGFGSRVTVRQAAFSELEAAVRAVGREPGEVDGLLADLGLSQMQLNDPGRGFSFAAEGMLDMRMNKSQELTAAQVVNHLGERELADVIYQYADERRSRGIAKAICRARPLHTARQLAEVVASAARGPRSTRIHPATRTFQALRMYVNDELGQLSALLSQLPGLLRPGGRAVVISFHSGEDRLVKDAFRRGAAERRYRILTKHVVWPSELETDRNPRARSARLRCVERI